VQFSGCVEGTSVSCFLSIYLGLGLSQIVRIDWRERLDLNVMDDEERSETIIALERDHYVRMTVHEKITFAPFNVERTTKLKERISHQLYTKMRGDKPILDSPGTRATLRPAKD
jgi:hypothetical protein